MHVDETAGGGDSRPRMLLALEHGSAVPLRRQLAGELRDAIRARPAAHRRSPARIACARRGARRLARGRHRRLRAADGRGLARRAARRRHDRGRRAGRRAAARGGAAPRRRALRLHADDARRIALPAPPVGARRRARGGGGARRGARLRQRVRRASRCARRWPATSAGSARPPQSPRGIIVCAGYSQATRLIFAVLADRGVRRVALEDPSLADHWDAAARAGSSRCRSRSTATACASTRSRRPTAEAVVRDAQPPVPDRRGDGAGASPRAARVGA